MKALVKALASKVIHSAIFQEFIRNKEKKELDRLSNPEYRLNDLIFLDQNTVRDIFLNKETEDVWKLESSIIKCLDLPDKTGGVNRGDQRAIFYLINHFKPKNVLEVGTHIGCSTVHIALALQKSANSSLTSVDIFDVNDVSQKRWLNFGSKHSPSELISMIGTEGRVEFVTNNSINFLQNCKKKFDFVFLDGSHKANMVYQEIPLALKLLNKNGIILLHDYFPDNKPLWSKASVIPGPYLAVQKIMREENNIKVISLGELPWATKANSRITSLAILTKKYEDASSNEIIVGMANRKASEDNSDTKL